MNEKDEGVVSRGLLRGRKESQRRLGAPRRTTLVARVRMGEGLRGRGAWKEGW